MTIHQAAFQILEEKQQPLSAIEISKIILDRRLKSSIAKDPLNSFAQTIEKNIRDNIYNDPPLTFIHSQRGRLIGLPAWEKDDLGKIADREKSQEITMRIPTDLAESIQLAVNAKLADSYEDTIILILKKGLTAIASTIKENLVKRLDKLDNL